MTLLPENLQAYDITQDKLLDLSKLFQPQPQPVTTLGLDCGTVHDYSALTVCDYEVRLDKPADWLDGENPYPRFSTHYHVRICERFPIGTSYPQVADKVCQIARKLYDRDQKKHLVCLIDATGVGLPVVQLIRQRIVHQVLVNGVVLTGGDKQDHNLLYKESAHVSKMFLVSRLQAILQSQRLHMPRTAQIQELIDELQNFQVRVKQNTGNLESGSFNLVHDDLAISLALAVAGDHAEPRLDQGLGYFGSPL